MDEIMRIDLQRKIDRVVGRIICRVFSLFSRGEVLKDPAPVPGKILIILLSEMGSLVLARPMFVYLKKRYPEAELFVLVFKKNRDCMVALQLVTEKNVLTVDGDSLPALTRDSMRVIVRMHKEMIDAVIDCELFSRISSIYAFLSGARIRTGFHPHTQEGLYRGDFINRPVLYNPYRHISRQFVHLAMAMEESDGFPVVKRNADEEIFHIPPLRPDGNEMSLFETGLKRDFPELAGKHLILLYPGGGLLSIRAWPLGNFCEIAKSLISDGYAVGVIGMKEDKPLAESISSSVQSQLCIDLTGYTKTVMELIILFHFASLLITNDGGPGHFASLTPISSIVFFGPETPALYSPLDEKSVSFYAPIPCSPCLTAYNHRNSPCDGNNVCLKSIRPKEVLETAHKLLNGAPVIKEKW
jgi:ADP-heptose:LPS heptosyltransferase